MMVINWEHEEPMAENEMQAVVVLIHRGKITDGTRVTRALLATLLGCTHPNGPCTTCANQLN
jgi:hypothetical protein